MPLLQMSANFKSNGRLPMSVCVTHCMASLQVGERTATGIQNGTCPQDCPLAHTLCPSTDAGLCSALGRCSYSDGLCSCYAGCVNIPLKPTIQSIRRHTLANSITLHHRALLGCPGVQICFTWVSKAVLAGTFLMPCSVVSCRE